MMIDLESQFNEDFKPAEIIRHLEGLLRAGWRDALDGRSVSTADLQAIAATHRAAIASVDSIFRNMTAQFEAGRQNLVRYWGIRFVSLGDGCLPRSLLTNWGIRPSSKLGERSHPFDMMMSNLPAVVELIRTGFQDMMNPEYLAFLPEKNHCGNVKLHLWFNHEQGPEYAENDFALLRKAYASRIEKFLSDLDAEDVVFIFHQSDPHRGPKPDLRQLIDVVSPWRKGRRTRYICLRTWPFGVQHEAQDGPDSSGVFFIEANYPMPDYSWWQNHFEMTPEGFAFETDLIDRIKAYLDGAPAMPALEHATSG